MSDLNHFILLCSAKRQKAYSEAVSAAEYPVEVVPSPEEALRACVRNPPLAVIVDMVTGMRAGNANTSLLALYNLELNWPVLRGTAKKNEPVMVLSTSPQISAPFCEGLLAIACEDPNWGQRESPRRFIRQEIQCRARVRLSNDADWQVGTVMEMSTGGCFVLSYEPLPVNSSVQLEIRDLTESPITLEARIVWTRNWNDSVKLPGMGLQFDWESPSAELADALSKRFL